MSSQKVKNKFQRLGVFLVMACMFFVSTVAVGGQESDLWRKKINADLWEITEEKSTDDLIPVYLWLKSIDHEIIKNALINEKGMDPAIYEDENRFYEEIVPEIAKKIEDRVGYEEAHRVVLPDGTVTTDIERDRLDLLNREPLNSEPEVSAASEELFMEYPEGMDLTISLIDRAVFAKAEEYIMAKREITKREYSAVNDAFLQTNIGNKQREIIYNSRYTSTLVVEATKAEIESYAKKDIVEEVSLFVETIQVPDLNITLGQIGADSSTGTKSSSFNAGAGYRGTNVKIGILEAGRGRFDSSAPQLNTISSSRLIFKNNAGIGGTPLLFPVVNEHATVVTSIIVGQSVSVSGTVYEGVVPLATVYQTPIENQQHVFNGIQKLADEGCLVINYSGGYDTGNLYDSYDKEVDNLIKNTAIVFVNSAGNTGNGTTNILSPGKALNAITVGNAQTKSNASTASASPFSMHTSSSFAAPSYLPNKPDISAPGSFIRVVKSTSGSDNFYYNNGADATGTSAAAPMVTGIVAQMIQARPSGALITNIKTQLLAGAQASKISTTNNPSAGNYLRQKSGTGLVDAKKSVNIIRNINSVTNRRTLTSTGQVSSFYMGYFYSSQKVRVVMTFYSLGPAGNITQTSHRDDINISIINGATGNSVANSSSAVNNVEIIEYTFVTTGWYDIRLSAYRVLAFSPGVVAVVTWTLI